MAEMDNLQFECTGLKDGGKFPLEYTDRGEDKSPEFIISNLSPKVKTIEITLDDLSIGNFNHWVIWNIPANAKVPGGIPAGKTVSSLGNAVQRVGYGRHVYAGPKPPKGTNYTYKFDLYALDGEIDLKSSADKKDFLKAASGHIIQHGSITGTFE